MLLKSVVIARETARVSTVRCIKFPWIEEGEFRVLLARVQWPNRSGREGVIASNVSIYPTAIFRDKPLDLFFISPVTQQQAGGALESGAHSVLTF